MEELYPGFEVVGAAGVPVPRLRLLGLRDDVGAGRLAGTGMDVGYVCTHDGNVGERWDCS